MTSITNHNNLRNQKSVDDFIKFIEDNVNDEWLWNQYFKDWLPYELTHTQKEFDKLRQYFMEHLKGRFIFVYDSADH